MPRNIDGDLDEEEGERIRLQSKSSRTALAKSARSLAETVRVSGEVLRSLNDDDEKIKSVAKKVERTGDAMNEAAVLTGQIEIAKMMQFACVCSALCLIVSWIAFLALRPVMGR